MQLKSRLGGLSEINRFLIDPLELTGVLLGERCSKTEKRDRLCGWCMMHALCPPGALHRELAGFGCRQFQECSCHTRALLFIVHSTRNQFGCLLFLRCFVLVPETYTYTNVHVYVYTYRVPMQVRYVEFLNIWLQENLMASY